MADHENLKQFILHEVTESEREQYSNSPAQSILKTPTAVFTTVLEESNRTGRRLTFASKAQDSVEARESSTDSSKSLSKQNGKHGSNTPMVEIAVSPSKSIRVSPESWRSHLTYRKHFKDYQNEMEKTDYTYSRLSPFYNKEITPGLHIRPNMSRLSLKASRSPEQTDGVSNSDYHSFHPDHRVPGSTPLADPQLFAKQWRKLRVSASRQLKWVEDSSRDGTFRWWWLLFFLLCLGTFPGVWYAPNFSSIPYNVPKFLQVFAVQNRTSVDLLPEESIVVRTIKPPTFPQTIDVNLLNILLERERRLIERLNNLEMSMSEIRQKKYSLHDQVQKLKEMKLIAPACRRVYHLQSNIEDLVRAGISQHVKSHSDTLWKLQRDLDVIGASVREIDAWKMSAAQGEGNRSVEALIEEAIRIYDADRTGRADFALESAGGRVVSTRCTVPYKENSQPAAAIRPGRALGECWAFQGEGRLVLELSHMIEVTGCSIEHVPCSIHPFGYTSSAPNVFTLLGLNNPEDENPHTFGAYQYSINGDTVQYFPVQHNPRISYKFVELVVQSNHGNENYTCLYRVRIHGQISGS